jgi:hypothetical protein
MPRAKRKEPPTTKAAKAAAKKVQPDESTLPGMPLLPSEKAVQQQAGIALFFPGAETQEHYEMNRREELGLAAGEPLPPETIPGIEGVYICMELRGVSDPTRPSRVNMTIANKDVSTPCCSFVCVVAWRHHL